MAGVGDPGAAGFGEDADGGVAGERLVEGGGDFGSFLEFVDGMPFVVVDDHFRPEDLQIAAGGAFVLHEKYLAGFDRVEDIGRKGGGDVLLQPTGDEIEGGGHVIPGSGDKD